MVGEACDAQMRSHWSLAPAFHGYHRFAVRVTRIKETITLSHPSNRTESTNPGPSGAPKPVAFVSGWFTPSPTSHRRRFFVNLCVRQKSYWSPDGAGPGSV